MRIIDGERYEECQDHEDEKGEDRPLSVAFELRPEAFPREFRHTRSVFNLSFCVLVAIRLAIGQQSCKEASGVDIRRRIEGTYSIRNHLSFRIRVPIAESESHCLSSGEMSYRLCCLPSSGDIAQIE